MFWIPTGPPRVGWDSAARSLEFIAPRPLIRPPRRGISVPIFTIAGAETQQKTGKEDLDTNIRVKDSQENATRPTVSRTPTIPEVAPFHLDDLTTDTAARVRLGMRTREPARDIPRGNPPATPISETEKRNRRIA